VEYTIGSVVAAAAVVGVELFWFRTGIFRKVTFWISYAIILFFQVLVDGWLTKLSAPIVVYNADENSGLRFPWDIPVEDYLFGFALIVLTILLWERAGRGRAARGSNE
jgi:lycopene cyclase domain-containing protein